LIVRNGRKGYEEAGPGKGSPQKRRLEKHSEATICPASNIMSTEFACWFGRHCEGTTGAGGGAQNVVSLNEPVTMIACVTGSQDC
jgi:hypothetical protein